MSSYIELARKELQARNLPVCERFCQLELESNPASLPALQMLADVYFLRKDYVRARLALTRLLTGLPGDADSTQLHMNLALVCLELKDDVGAERAFSEVLSRRPNDIDALAYLAGVAYATADMQRARECIAGFIANLQTAPRQLVHNPDLMARGVNLAGKLVRVCDCEQWLDILERIEANPHYAVVASHAAFLFGMAQIVEKTGDVARSLDYYRRANAAKRAKSGFRIQPVLSFLDGLRDTFDRAFFELDISAAPRQGDPVPIFIVGMPRSGTSLIEQILAAHSAVTPLGEATILSPLVEKVVVSIGGHKGPADYHNRITRESTVWVREQYFRQANLPKGCRFFTDKLPANIHAAWMMVHAFPEARILVTSRDKMATVMSCFTAGFGDGQAFSESLADCAAYYDGIKALSEHWLTVLGESVRQVRYEALVTDPRPEIEGILAFIGLDVEQACFHPEKLSRGVRTASAHQVTQPIYQSGNARWERFRDYLGEDLALLVD